jgi:hypothetical protein
MGLFKKKVKKNKQGDVIQKGLPLTVETGFGVITKHGFTTIYEIQGKPGHVCIINGKNEMVAKVKGIHKHDHKGKCQGTLDLQLEAALGLEFSITIRANQITLIALSSIIM